MARALHRGDGLIPGRSFPGAVEYAAMFTTKHPHFVLDGLKAGAFFWTIF